MRIQYIESVIRLVLLLSVAFLLTLPAGAQAADWKEGVMINLEAPSAGPVDAKKFSVAHAISADGAVIIGDAGNRSALPVFWRKGETKPVALEVPDGVEGLASAVSADGSTIIGDRSDPRHLFIHAVSWNGHTGKLTTLSASNSAFATAVSADGSIIAVALPDKKDPDSHVGYWKNGAIFPVLLKSSDIGKRLLRSVIMSRDGSAIVASYGGPGSDCTAFWKNGVPMPVNPLGCRNQNKESQGAVTDINADGSVVVGYLRNGSDDYAVYWEGHPPSPGLLGGV